MNNLFGKVAGVAGGVLNPTEAKCDDGSDDYNKVPQSHRILICGESISSELVSFHLLKN